MSEAPEEKPTTPTAVDQSQSIPDAAQPSTLPEPSVESVAEPHLVAYVGFDPEKHRVGPDGKPVMTPTGRYAKKSQSRTGAPSVSTSANAGQKGVAGAKVDNWPIAKQTVNVGINLAVKFFGPEWEPQSKEEPVELATAFRDYFDARGVPQMPPEVTLLLAIAAYALPRFSHENTKGKIQRMFSKVMNWRDALKRDKR
jgi:hypothetical protein